MTIIEKILIAALIIIGLIAAGSAFRPAAAQDGFTVGNRMLCGPTAPMIATLEAEKYQEAPVGAGTDQYDNAITAYVGPHGTFTLILTFTSGPYVGSSCLLAVGDQWAAPGETAPPPFIENEQASPDVDERGA